MRLTLNGREREVPELANVEELIAHLGIHRMIVVEHNGEILKKGQFGAATLADGDQLEIVHMVGGGRG
jgi:sulfur carrier protein